MRVDIFVEIQEHVEALISYISDGMIVDFQPLFFRFTLDTTTYLLFDRSIHSIGRRNYAGRGIRRVFPYRAGLPCTP